MGIYDHDWSKDPFEEKIKMIEQMTDAQIKNSMEQIKFICKDYCGKCPTYKNTGEVKLGFCTMGKSKVIHQKKECLCSKCPISKSMSMRWKYYCTEGTAIELSVAEHK